MSKESVDTATLDTLLGQMDGFIGEVEELNVLGRSMLSLGGALSGGFFGLLSGSISNSVIATLQSEVAAMQSGKDAVRATKQAYIDGDVTGSGKLSDGVFLGDGAYSAPEMNIYGNPG